MEGRSFDNAQGFVSPEEKLYNQKSRSGLKERSFGMVKLKKELSRVQAPGEKETENR